MAYPFTAVDTARNTERLSAFLSAYIEEKPVDQYFEDYPTIAFFYKNKTMIDGGAQMAFPIGKGESPNNAWARDYDIIGSAGTNNATTVVYDFANIYDSYVISWAEMREISGSDHKIFDRVKAGRDVVQNTTLKNLNEAFYASTQSTSKIQSMAVGIDSTGSCGSLSQATTSEWASQESAHSAAYSVGGYDAILEMMQDLKQVKSKSSVMFTTYDIERAIELEMNVDVRYANSPDTLKRGATKLMIKNTPIIADADATAQAIYFVNTDRAKLYVDTEGDMQWDEMEKMPYQKAFMAKFAFRGQFVITDRRGQGKITGITT